MMLETILLLIASFLLGVGSLAVVVWLLLTGQFASLDGLFLTFACLILALVFFLNCGWSLRSQEFRQWWQSRSKS